MFDQASVTAPQGFLARRAPYGDVRRPDLILLDLNLPGRSGWEILADIKHEPSLRHIRVVGLTSSDVDRDIALSYEKGANAHFTKPVDFEGFVRVVNAVEHFWFTIVRLPPHPDHRIPAASCPTRGTARAGPAGLPASGQSAAGTRPAA